MKYLKLYENIDIPKIKKYFIWFCKDEIDILENTKHTSTHLINDKHFRILNTKHIYRYKDKELKKVKGTFEGTTFGIIIDPEIYEEYKNNILFQSNSLKQCLDELNIIITAENYNL